MATSGKKARQSLAFSTPQSNRKSSHSRRSLSNLDQEENYEDAKELLGTFANTPLKKAMLMQFLSYNKDGHKDVLEFVKKKVQKEKQPANAVPVMSPRALRNKRALEAMNASEETSKILSQKNYNRAAVPFAKLLQGVVAYAEIITNDEDRSAGVKALLKAMGAKVSEKIRRGITHAVIKDVSYETYRKANLVNAHLVSVLWLEAVRKNHCRVPEKHYPALGPEAYGSNVSLLCEKLQEDYADVVKDELERSRNLIKRINLNLSTRFAEDIININQDNDVKFNTEAHTSESLNDPRMENIPSDPSSDLESEIGLVNGEITQRGENGSHSESSDAIEYKIVNSMSSRLKDFSNSSSLSSRNTSFSSRNSSPVKNVSSSSKKRPTSASKENLDASLNNSQQKKSLPDSNNTSENNEFQVHNVLSELQLSEDAKWTRKSGTPKSVSKKLSSSNLSDNNSRNNSINLRVSSDSSKEVVAVSESVPSLRISSGSSKRRTTGSSALSSLRISTESTKSKRPSGSEPIPSLRISSSSSKYRTAESSTASSLQISSDSNKEDSTNDLLKEVPESPIRGTGKSGPYVHVTLRKKRNVVPRTALPKNKRKLYDPNRVNYDLLLQKTTNGEKTKVPTKKNVEIAPVLMTPSARRLIQKKLPNVIGAAKEDVNGIKSDASSSSSKKRKLETDDHKFKTPGEPIRTKKVTQTCKKAEIIPSKRITRSSSCSQSETDAPRQKDRRSTLEFLPKDLFGTASKNKNTQVKPKKMTGIVCSRFHTKEVQTFMQIVEKLGTFFSEMAVSDKTSHLVLGEPMRTVNVLRALARGCWILRPEWLYKSMEEGKWLPEEDYEMIEYSPIVQITRLERQAFGWSYSMDLFSCCGNIYVAKSTSPRCSDLQDLIKLCKGTVARIRRNADVIVGEYIEGNATCVSVNWILDSVSSYKIQSYKKYSLGPPAQPRRNSEYC